MKQPGKQSMVRPVFVQRNAMGAASSSASLKSTAGRSVAARRGRGAPLTAPRGRGAGPVA